MESTNSIDMKFDDEDISSVCFSDGKIHVAISSYDGWDNEYNDMDIFFKPEELTQILDEYLEWRQSL